MKPTLSIVTVAAFDLNRLKRTISSFDYSTPRIEHIVVVPSTDFEGIAYMNLICESYSNVLLVHDAGEGIYPAMNIGAFAASGDFVIFWNAGEELIHKDELIGLIDHICSVPLFVFLIGWNDANGYHRPDDQLVLSFLRNELNGFISHQAFILSLRLFKNISGFNTRYRVAADTRMMRSILLNHKVGFFDKPVVWVEPQFFSSRNHRRGRIEFFWISLMMLTSKFGATGVKNVMRNEFVFFLNRVVRTLRGHY